MLLYSGLIVLIELGFDEFRIVFDRASKTNAEIFVGFGFNRPVRNINRYKIKW
jgi:hypothetical protein